MVQIYLAPPFANPEVPKDLFTIAGNADASPEDETWPAAENALVPIRDSVLAARHGCRCAAFAVLEGVAAARRGGACLHACVRA